MCYPKKFPTSGIFSGLKAELPPCLGNGRCLVTMPHPTIISMMPHPFDISIMSHLTNISIIPHPSNISIICGVYVYVCVCVCVCVCMLWTFMKQSSYVLNKVEPSSFKLQASEISWPPHIPRQQYLISWKRMRGSSCKQGIINHKGC